MNMLDVIESENLKAEVPEFNIGDTVKVFVKIKVNEGSIFGFRLPIKGISNIDESQISS